MEDKIINKKFPRELRTFETRLLFIKDIFLNKYSRSDIMANCIQYKLGKSLENYAQELKTSVNYLETEDSLAVLKKIDK